MPASVPVSVPPDTVTVLPVPTFLFEKLPESDVRLTESVPSTPPRIPPETVAAVVASYTLFCAVKPVAVSVATVMSASVKAVLLTV